MPKEKTGKKIIAVNRKARHDYFVEDTYEAGIALYGTEVKSVRQGQVNLKDSYCKVKNGELFAVGDLGPDWVLSSVGGPGIRYTGA